MMDELIYCAIKQGYESEWSTRTMKYIDWATWARLKEIEELELDKLKKEVKK